MRRRTPDVRLPVPGLVACLVVALWLSGCVPMLSAEQAPVPRSVVDVVTDFNILEAFVTEVGAEHVSVTSLVPLGGDPHMYEPRPRDAIAIAEADIVFVHGLGLSPWMRGLQDHAAAPAVTIGDVVRDRAVRDDEGLLDPHLWLVPPLAAEYAEAISDALTDVYPEAGEDFVANAERFRDRLAALDEELQAAFATVPEEHRYLVTPHDAYGYFSEHYGLEVLGTLVGVSTEEQPSARTMRELVDDVLAHEVPAVFIESTIPPRTIERVAIESGAAIAGPLYADSFGPPGSGADDYFGMMRHNARTIVEALGGRWP